MGWGGGWGNAPNFRMAEIVAKPKICIKAQFESPKYLHQKTFKNLKYQQKAMF
jgi:hypothetical protein